MNDLQPVLHQAGSYSYQLPENQRINVPNKQINPSNQQISTPNQQFNAQNYHNNIDLPYTLNQQATLGNQNLQLLGQSQLQIINKQMNSLQRDIVDNNKEIRFLNNKMTKSHFQHSQLKKLYQKQNKLRQKQMQFEEVLKNHEFLKEQMLRDRLKQSQIKHSLGDQYQKIVQQKKHQQRQLKQRQKQQQSQMLSYNQQAMFYEKQRKRQHMQQQKYQAQQQLQQREYARQIQRQLKQKQRFQYNQKMNYRKQLQTQKDHVYRQYYSHFMDEQDKLQSIYKNNAMEAENNKERQRQQKESKDYETFQVRMARENQEKLRKITYERESLKDFLQTQIQQNSKRKNKEKQEEARFQGQVKSYQINLNDYEGIQRQRKRQMQKLYENQLSSQIEFKNFKSQQDSSAHLRSSSLGNSQQLPSQITHNPVTNPIDFKLGITNRYIIKEYQNTKQKYMGDHNLKLRNLAVIGNNSLVNSYR